MDRLLIIVHRDAPRLLQHLEAAFASSAPDIRVIRDRRTAERRVSSAPTDVERRRAERRRRDVGEALRRVGWVVLRPEA
jgi:hypothetical protein